MKREKCIKVLFVLMALVLLVTPMQALAFDDTSTSKLAQKPIEDDIDIPPLDEISKDLAYSEGFTSTKTTVSGGCSITKLSSSSVNIYGYTSCSPSSPAVRVTLKLQAYYGGAWHTLATKYKQQSGTFVSLSKNYTVTSGYYYRVYAIHSTGDGTTAYSNTGAIWVN